ncbi:MAG: thioredoxin-related protein [Crocinitomix sp.]|jgi:thioredoxin-related protein
MKKGIFKYGIVLAAVSFMLSCGNGAEIAEGPAPTEKEGSGNGSATIETFGSAEAPDVRKNNEQAPEEIKVEGDAVAIEWLDFETAIDRNAVEKKFIFIDMYTEWCGWCKKMDASTFKDPSVINYIDQNFYAVKLNPETETAIAYKEVLYEQKTVGNKKMNELAINLMESKIGFPAFVVLNKREVKRGVIRGYQTSNQLLLALKRYVD